MLRISTGPAEFDLIVLQLEGQISGPWVDLLRETVRAKTPSPSDLQLDLSGVQFADEPGLQLLRELQDHGAVLRAASPFIRSLLNGPR